MASSSPWISRVGHFCYYLLNLPACHVLCAVSHTLNSHKQIYTVLNVKVLKKIERCKWLFPCSSDGEAAPVYLQRQTTKEQTGTFDDTAAWNTCGLKNTQSAGRVQWLTPVIPALWEAEAVDHEVKRSRLSWSTWWNPISTKNLKITGMVGAYLWY